MVDALPAGDLVAWRMANGSACHVCPLNAQRRVGVDGPRDAGVVLIGEAPGREEEEYNSRYQPHGRPFVGRSGWALKARLLAPVGLCDTEVQEDGWVKPTKLNVFVMNVVMCRPPNNKINSPEGKKAVACCSNSARALLSTLLEQNPDRTLVPLGGTALNLVAGESTIAPFRGRVLKLQDGALDVQSEMSVLRVALRGVPPPTEFAPYDSFLRKVLAVQKKFASLPAPARTALLEKQCLRIAKPYLRVLAACLKVQVPKLARAKRSPSVSVSPRQGKLFGPDSESSPV